MKEDDWLMALILCTFAIMGFWVLMHIWSYFKFCSIPFMFFGLYALVRAICWLPTNKL